MSKVYDECLLVFVDRGRRLCGRNLVSILLWRKEKKDKIKALE